MKEVYERPEMEIIRIEAEDVIATSGEELREDNDANLADLGWG